MPYPACILRNARTFETVLSNTRGSVLLSAPFPLEDSIDE